MAFETKHFCAALMPDYPRYQAYLESVRKNFASFEAGQRARIIVHQGVLVRRMIRMNSAMADFPAQLVQFSLEALDSGLGALINFGAMSRSANEIHNAMEEAYKIFREEEDHYGAQQLMLQQFEPSPNQRPN